MIGSPYTPVPKLIYAVSIAATFVHPWIAGFLYVGVALIWLVPDRRIEQMVAHRKSQTKKAVFVEHKSQKSASHCKRTTSRKNY